MLQAQGLPYLKRVTKTKFEGSLKDFLLASGKQLDIKSNPSKKIKSEPPKHSASKSKAPNERPDDVGGLGSKHAQLLIRLVKSCSEEVVSKVVTSMKEEQLDTLSQVMESCPLEMTARVVGSLVEMGSEEFDFITNAVKSFTKEKLGTVVENLANVSRNLPQISQELQKSQNVKEEGEGQEDSRLVLEEDTVEHELTSEDLDEIYTKEGHDENEIANKIACEENEIYTNDEALIGNETPSNEMSNVKNERKIDTTSTVKDLSIDIVKKKKKKREHNKNHNNVENELKFETQSPLKDLEKDSTKKKHKKRKRTGKKKKVYTCTICGITLNRGFNCEVQRHIATHTGERDFKCDECGSKFSRVQELTRHEKIHRGHCPFRCNHCNAGFKAEMALRAHKSSIHYDQTTMASESDAWLFDCKQCDSNFKSAIAFGKHMKLLHGVGNPFMCDKCGMGMSTNDNLKRHALVAHSDSKPFHCEECGAMIGNKASLERHQLGHARTNGSLSLEQEQVLREQSESEKRICDLCGKKLSSTVTMRRHMRIHNSGGLKCYTCQECGKAFSDKRGLSHHIDIIHQQLKKFPCTICGDKFGRRNNLKDHEKRKHTGKKNETA